MAEETKHAASVVPKAMITAYYINAGLAFIITVTFCFVLVDYDKAVNSPVGAFGFPYIQVFVNATSKSPFSFSSCNHADKCVLDRLHRGRFRADRCSHQPSSARHRELDGFQCSPDLRLRA